MAFSFFERGSGGENKLSGLASSESAISFSVQTHVPISQTTHAPSRTLSPFQTKTHRYKHIDIDVFTQVLNLSLPLSLFYFIPSSLSNTPVPHLLTIFLQFVPLILVQRRRSGGHRPRFSGLLSLLKTRVTYPNVIIHGSVDSR